MISPVTILPLQSSFRHTQLHPRRMCRFRLWTLVLVSWFCVCGKSPADDPATTDGLIGHWPLHGDAGNLVEGGVDAIPHNVVFNGTGPNGMTETSAAFNGVDAWLEVPASEQSQFGFGDFSIAAWVRVAGGTNDVPGDIVSWYDPDSRTGFHLGIKTSSVTTSQANYRQLQFGIDADQPMPWYDMGRPGNALLAFALCDFNGQLYAGTCEPAAGEAGHVYRFDGEEGWTDLGSLDCSNSVTALAEFDGHLYAATGKYRVAGSALPESENQTLGGRIFRLEDDGTWMQCGQLPSVEAIAGLVVYGDKLYASSLYAPAGFFRYEGGTEWSDCGVPDGTRVEAMAVYNGHLYATSYDRGHVARFDGERWLDCGQLGPADENTQTYSFAVYHGRLYCGTWRTGRVYRFESPGAWTDVGRLGEELEVMGMLVHNGRLIAGTLPLAEVYQYEGGDTWSRLVQLDETPDVQYRRAWTMAEHDGRVYCSTLPSGHVFSWNVGVLATSPRAFPDGWHHVAAVRSNGRLSLYVDGLLDSESHAFDDAAFDLTATAPLRIGAGPNDFFAGEMSDVRIYDRGLSAADVQSIMQEASAGTNEGDSQ